MHTGNLTVILALALKSGVALSQRLASRKLTLTRANGDALTLSLRPFSYCTQRANAWMRTTPQGCGKSSSTLECESQIPSQKRRVLLPKSPRIRRFLIVIFTLTRTRGTALSECAIMSVTRRTGSAIETDDLGDFADDLLALDCIVVVQHQHVLFPRPLYGDNQLTQN